MKFSFRFSFWLKFVGTLQFQSGPTHTYTKTYVRFWTGSVVFQVRAESHDTTNRLHETKIANRISDRNKVSRLLRKYRKYDISK